MSKQKDHKIRRIRKNRIWPIVLINLSATILVFLAIASAMALYIGSVLQNKLDTSSEVVKNYSNLVESYFVNGQKEAANYAAVISDNYSYTATTLDLQEELSILNSLNSYEDIGIIDMNGNVTSSSNAFSNVTDMAFFQETLDKDSGIYFSDIDEINRIFFTSIIKVNNEAVGVLYLSNTNHINVAETNNGLWNIEDPYYILDKDNNVIAYIGDTTEDFDYKSINQAGIINTGMSNTKINDILFGDNNHSIDLNQISGNALENHSLIKNGIYNEEGFISMGIWYENKLSINDWRTVSYRSIVFDSLSLRDIFRVLIIGILIMSLPLLFIFILTIMQGKTNKKLTKLLYLDTTTGGHNFLYFKTEALKLMKKKKFINSSLAIITISLDKYKIFCDMHEHVQCEELLETINDYLQAKLKKKELVVRYSEAQFSLLLISQDGTDIMERINHMLEGLTFIFPNEKTSYSTGIYFVQDRQMSMDRMNNFAILAKDTIESNQKNRVVIFDNVMRDELVREKEIENLMEKAIHNKEFIVFLQPKYNVTGETLSGAEALVRWISPEKGFVSPGAFIPTFEKNGFIVKLDDYMITEVSKLLRKWLDAGKIPVPISVNISRVHFMDVNLAEHIKELVDKYNVPHSLIELELTESAFFDNKNVLLETVNRFRKYGFTVSMDDFGAGYSSLNSLKDLPLDVIKLDGEFFRNTENIERGQIVVKDTITLAKNLHMKIVAEGIETKEQVEFLQTIGCDLIQGFYFAKPMPVDQFEKL